MNDKIDFVITWVDGSDPEWQAEKEKYNPPKKNNSAAVNRFRDWDLLRYWFRGVEKYAPWVNHIYFITCGHYPKWLNLKHPKLTLVRHEDYIPHQYLPTFNSNVIELFVHYIDNLSEQFVLFNDDMFLTSPATPKDFFRDGRPCDSALLDHTISMYPEDVFPHILLNNLSVINVEFEKRTVLQKYWSLFLTPKYGHELIRNLLLWPFKYFSGFYDLHLPSSHLRSTFQEVWFKESKLLLQTASHRFRSTGDLSHWLMKNWQICQGKIAPRSCNWGKHFELVAGNQEIYDTIKRQSYTSVCLNDSSEDVDFKETKKKLIEAFEQILPEKSSYEC